MDLHLEWTRTTSVARLPKYPPWCPKTRSIRTPVNLKRTCAWKWRGTPQVGMIQITWNCSSCLKGTAVKWLTGLNAVIFNPNTSSDHVKEGQQTNIIKIRDDNDYFSFTKQESGFLGEEAQTPSWSPAEKKLGEISLSVLCRDEPWLTSLFQSEHLAVLTGNGLSTRFNIWQQTSNNAMSLKDIDSVFKDIQKAADKIAQNNNRGEPNIEDSIRVISELLRGLEILRKGRKWKQRLYRWKMSIRNLLQTLRTVS